MFEFLFVFCFLLLSKSYRQDLSSDGQVIFMGISGGITRKGALNEDRPEGLHWDSGVSHECRAFQVLPCVNRWKLNSYGRSQVHRLEASSQYKPRTPLEYLHLFTLHLEHF